MKKPARKSPRSDEPLVQRVYYRRGSAEVLLALSESGQMRFVEICRSLPSFSEQTVSARLADLREIGMVDHQVLEGPPIGAVYSLTELGRTLAGAAHTIRTVANSRSLPGCTA